MFMADVSGAIIVVSIPIIVIHLEGVVGRDRDDRVPIPVPSDHQAHTVIRLDSDRAGCATFDNLDRPGFRIQGSGFRVQG